MRNPILASLLSVSMFLSPLASAPPAFAEPTKEEIANAKALAKEGRELREQGRYKEALVKFEAAWAYVQTPLTGRDLAQELERDGRIVEARLIWGDVAGMPAKPGDTKEHEDARALANKKLGELDKRIPTIVIDVKGTAPKVTLDGKDVPLATLGTSRRVNPGAHTLSASGGGAPVSTSFSVKEGERDRVVSIVVTGSTTVAAPPNAGGTEPASGAATGAATGPTTGAGAAGEGPQKFQPGPPVSPRRESSGSGLTTTGAIAITFGVLGVIGGGVSLAYGFSKKMDNEPYQTPTTIGWVGLGAGTVLFFGGVVMVGVGSSNSHAANRTTLNVAVTPRGLALAGQF